MKKKLGFLAAVSLITIGVITANETNCEKAMLFQDKSNSYLDTASSLGFSIPSTYSPRFHINRETQYDFYHGYDKYEIQNKMQYYTEYYDCLLRNNNDSSLFLYVYRITAGPHKGRNWGFLGIGSYGEDWRLKEVRTTIQLASNQQILNYAPLNSPSRYTTSIGFGVGADGANASVTASVSYDHNELNVFSNTSTGSRLYETIYTVDYSSENSYNSRQSYHYGLLYFKIYNASYTNLTVSHDVKYYGPFGGYTRNQHFGYTYMTY